MHPLVCVNSEQTKHFIWVINPTFKKKLTLLIYSIIYVEKTHSEPNMEKLVEFKFTKSFL